MITEETLFILGAGASTPYGFPTGRKLRTYIFSEFPLDYERILKDYGEMEAFFCESEIQKARFFADTFHNSSSPSIDQFLATSPGFKDIGKIAIAAAILKFEEESYFREKVKLESDWYRFLFEKMIRGFSSPESCENFAENKVAFITFNYDRSLEHFLYESLINLFYDKMEVIARNPLSFMPFPFIHIYGYLDKPVWAGGSEYRTQVDYRTIDRLKHNIRVVGERPIEISSKLIELFERAQNIFFLGFGYDPENIKALGLPDNITGDHRIFGTAMNYTEKERMDITKLLSQCRGGIPVKIIRPQHIAIKDANCHQLLRNYL